MRCKSKSRVVHSLASAYDFAVAFGGQDVYTEGDFGSCRVRGHVEGFDGAGEAIDHDGLGELLGEDGLVAAAQVGAPFDFAAVGF